MIIIITGTPCTGKTTIADELARIMKRRGINFRVVHINEIVVKKKFYSGVDAERKTKNVDMKKLKNCIKKIISKNKNVILESHFAHDFGGDVVFVLRTKPNELRRRMEMKKWKKPKIEENLEAERLNLILGEALDMHNRVVEIDTTNKTPRECANEMFEIIKKVF